MTCFMVSQNNHKADTKFYTALLFSMWYTNTFRNQSTSVTRLQFRSLYSPRKFLFISLPLIDVVITRGMPFILRVRLIVTFIIVVGSVWLRFILDNADRKVHVFFIFMIFVIYSLHLICGTGFKYESINMYDDMGLQKDSIWFYISMDL